MSLNLPPPHASERVEEVPIETIHVGDFVFIDATSGGADQARCVLGLTTTRHRQSNRVIGWLIELEGGANAWLRRGVRVKRTRAAIRA
jgi:hypothetical protein